MAARFCANCGTEVDESAIFCPTCGQPIDQATEMEMPAAPAWPEPSSDEPSFTEPAEPVREVGWAPPPASIDEPTRVEERPEAAAPVPAPRPVPRAEAPRRDSPPINLPLTMPVTMSAWLIGAGAAIAALGVLISLFDGFLNPIELILLIVLVGIAASVFFAASMPAIPQLRLATLVVVLIGFGIALDRLAFGGAGIGELLLFLGTAAAAIGAIILELGRDQPMGAPRG
jgi:hypothetical protein